MGKTEIAKVLAETLGRKLVRLQCYEGLDVASAVYEWNYPRQMLEIRLAEAAGTTRPRRLAHDIFDERFLIRRPLLQALEPDPAGPPVLLIDELDRTDEPFEAFLLEVLADFQVTVPGDRHLQGRAAADRHHHQQPHARDPRRAEAALLLPLGRLSRRPSGSWRSSARASPGRSSGSRPADRAVRAGAAPARPVQAAGRRRDPGLDAGAPTLDTLELTPERHQRHAGHAAQVPGRHRQARRAARPPRS